MTFAADFDTALNKMIILQSELVRQSQTVAVAESCTGGLISTLFTEIPGSSRVFMGGLAAYSDHVKVDLLKVPRGLLDRHGAVSEEVANAMALGAATLMRAKIGVGVTGIAGPDGGTAEKPVGTVWLAISVDGDIRARNLKLMGSRREIRVATALRAIEALQSTIEGQPW